MPAADALFRVADGTVVLVTGGAGGIGFAIARAFAERGAAVAIADVGAGRARDAAARAAAGATGRVSGYECDMRDAAAVEAAVRRITGDLGCPHVLVNCAGITIRKPATELAVDEYDRIMGVNARGTWVTSAAVAREMVRHGVRGCVVNLDSLVTHHPLKHVAAYTASKGAVAGMTRALAVEWGPRGIRVNAVAPGFVHTDISAALWSKPHMRKWADESTPLREMPRPEDIAGVVLFLATPAARLISGQVLRVDGGVTAGMHWPIDQDEAAAAPAAPRL